MLFTRHNNVNTTLAAIAAWGILMLFGLPSSGKADQSAFCDSFLWFEYGPTIRGDDGSVTQRFFIRTEGNPQDCWAPISHLDLNASYRINELPFGRQVRNRENSRQDEPEEYYRLEIKTQAGIPYMDVSTGAFSVVHIRVTADGKDIRMRAFTACTLFGGSKRSGGRSSPDAEAVHTLRPSIRLTPAYHHYWMQTGIPYHFTYQSIGENSLSAAVIDPDKSRGSFRKINLDAENGLHYTFPHEPDLDQAGPSASREKVLLIRETDRNSLRAIEYRTTYTIHLHRSRYGHRKMTPGVAMFLSAVVGTAAGTLNARKGSPY